jgi:hypothetical protein
MAFFFPFESLCGAKNKESDSPIRKRPAGSTNVVMGQVLGGGEMSSERSKNAFVFDFLFAFGRWWAISAGLVCEIGRQDL